MIIDCIHVSYLVLQDFGLESFCGPVVPWNQPVALVGVSFEHDPLPNELGHKKGVVHPICDTWTAT